MKIREFLGFAKSAEKQISDTKKLVEELNERAKTDAELREGIARKLTFLENELKQAQRTL